MIFSIFLLISNIYTTNNSLVNPTTSNSDSNINTDNLTSLNEENSQSFIDLVNEYRGDIDAIMADEMDGKKAKLQFLKKIDSMSKAGKLEKKTFILCNEKGKHFKNRDGTDMIFKSSYILNDELNSLLSADVGKKLLKKDTTFFIFKEVENPTIGIRYKVIKCYNGKLFPFRMGEVDLK